MNRKGLVGLAKVSGGIGALVALIVLFVFYVVPALAVHTTALLVTPNEVAANGTNAKVLAFTITNAAGSNSNITNVTITAPSGFTFATSGQTAPTNWTISSSAASAITFACAVNVTSNVNCTYSSISPGGSKIFNVILASAATSSTGDWLTNTFLINTTDNATNYWQNNVSVVRRVLEVVNASIVQPVNAVDNTVSPNQNVTLRVFVKNWDTANIYTVSSTLTSNNATGDTVTANSTARSIGTSGGADYFDYAVTFGSTAGIRVMKGDASGGGNNAVGFNQTVNVMAGPSISAFFNQTYPRTVTIGDTGVTFYINVTNGGDTSLTVTNATLNITDGTNTVTAYLKSVSNVLGPVNGPANLTFIAVNIPSGFTPGNYTPKLNVTGVDGNDNGYATSFAANAQNNIAVKGTLAITGTSTAPANVDRNQQNIVMEKFTFTAAGESINVNQLNLTMIGTAANTSVTAVKLYTDDNNNGVLDSTETQIGSTTAFGPDEIDNGNNKTAMFGNPKILLFNVSTSYNKVVLVVFNIAAGATDGTTAGVQMSAATNATANGTTTSVVITPSGTYPISSNTATIKTVSAKAKLGVIGISGTRSANAGKTYLFNYTVTNDGSDNITTVNITVPSGYNIIGTPTSVINGTGVSGTIFTNGTAGPVLVSVPLATSLTPQSGITVNITATTPATAGAATWASIVDGAVGLNGTATGTATAGDNVLNVYTVGAFANVTVSDLTKNAPLSSTKTFWFNITNVYSYTGTDSITALNITIPAGFTGVSVTGNAASNGTIGAVIVNSTTAPTLISVPFTTGLGNATAKIIIQATTPSTGGSYNWTSTIDGAYNSTGVATTELVSGDRTLTITVISANVSVTPNTTNTNQQRTYAFSVMNNGTAIIDYANISVPTGYTINSVASPAGCGQYLSTNYVVCQSPWSVSPGLISDVSITATAPATAGAATWLAAVKSSGVGPVTAGVNTTNSNVVTVQTPPILLISSITATNATVVRNQTGLGVSVVVNNAGGAAANSVSAYLNFSFGTANQNNSYFVSTPAARTIGAGASATYNFNVLIVSNASIGLHTMLPWAIGTDGNTNGQVQNISGVVTKSWIMHNQSDLEVSALSSNASRISNIGSAANSTFRLTVPVNNWNGSAAYSLQPNVIIKNRNGIDISSGFTITRVDSVQSIDNSTGANLLYDITQGNNTYNGNAYVNVNITYSDLNTNLTSINSPLNTSYEKNVSFTVDNAAPAVFLQSVTGAAFTNGSVKKASDVITLNITVNDTNIWQFSSFNCKVTIGTLTTYIANASFNGTKCAGNVTLTGLEALNGNQTINIQVNDTLGNVGTNASYTVDLDNTYPTLYSFTSNATATRVNTTKMLQFNVTASDLQGAASRGIASVDINGTGLYQVLSSNIWLLNRSLDQFGVGGCNTDGNCVLFANITDNVGLSSNTTLTIVTDNTKPILTLYDYTNATAKIIGQTLALNVMLNDTGGIASGMPLNVNINGTLAGLLYLSGSNWYNGSVTVPTSGIINGNATITINVTDIAGNTGVNSNYTVNAQLDNVPPVARVYSATGNFANNTLYKSGDVVSMYVAVTDVGSGIASNAICGFNVSGVASASTVAYSNGWCNGTMAIPAGLPNGNLTLSVNVTDSAGNVAINNSYAFDIDNTVPFSIVNSPQNNTINSTAVLLNLTITENFTAVNTPQYRILNTTWAGSWTALTQAGTSSFYTASANLATLADGSYNITFQFNDTVNNRNTTFINITVDNTAPVITVTYPGSGAYIKNSNNNSIWINGTITDNVNMTSLTINISDSARFAVSSFNSTSGRFGITNTTTVTDGSQSITLTYNDTAGNMGSATVTFNVDNTAPTAMAAGTVGYYPRNASQQIFVTVTDAQMGNLTVNMYYRFAYDPTGQWTGPVIMTAVGTPSATTTYAATLPTNNVTDGDARLGTQTLSYYVTGADNASNAIPTTSNASAVIGNMTVDNCGKWGTKVTCARTTADSVNLWYPSFTMPRTATLSSISSLNSNYSVPRVLDDINGSYYMIYQVNTTAVTSYKPDRAVNSFTEFIGEADNYYINMTTAKVLRVV